MEANIIIRRLDEKASSSGVHGTLALQLGFDHEGDDEAEQDGHDEEEVHSEIAQTVDDL